MMAPNRAAAEQYPMAVPLTLVGYTSGVYTYTAWNTPVAKARMKKRKKVMTFLEGKGSWTNSFKIRIHTIPQVGDHCINYCLYSSQIHWSSPWVLYSKYL